MTIKLTENEFLEQFHEAEEEQLQWDTSDGLDVTQKFDARIAQGWWRTVELREGIWLEINKAQHRDRLIVDWSYTERRCVRFSFTLSGKLQSTFASTSSEIIHPCISGKYLLKSNGLNPQHVCDCLASDPYYELQILIVPEILRSFAASPYGKLPEDLQHLVKTPDEVVYARSGDTTSEMTMVLQKILHCPYQGMVKRAFLEGKATELMALVLEQEVAIQQGEVKKVSLKPEQIERIHFAKEILLRDLNNPPSLAKLAQKAGLGEFMLRQGFHHCFDTTVFGVLQSHRLELARQILAEQNISVTEAAYRVGYTSTSYFSRAFKRKFGISPKTYQKNCR